MEIPYTSLVEFIVNALVHRSLNAKAPIRIFIFDYRVEIAGLTDADLNMIGVDFLLQTEEESSIADELENMMYPVVEQREAEKAERKSERDAVKAAQEEADRAAKVAHMKDVKQQVRENAQKQAENMYAYLMLSFDTWEAKAAFCERFGYDPYTKFVKGEVFDEQVERID